jgi:hypothetical protein
MERISTRYEEAVQRSQVRPRISTVLGLSGEYEEGPKKFCRGCHVFTSGGLCALNGEVQDGGAIALTSKSCINCRYSVAKTTALLQCILMGLSELPDEELTTDD